MTQELPASTDHGQDHQNPEQTGNAQYEQPLRLICRDGVEDTITRTAHVSPPTSGVLPNSSVSSPVRKCVQLL